MKNKLIAVTGMLLIAISMFATDDFKYARSLSGITETWHRIILPDDLFMNAGNALSDLRIIGVTPEKDTIEAPYILKIKKGTAQSKLVNFKTINEAIRLGKKYITFSVSKKDFLNEIHLFFDNRNFDWKVTLEGSHDQKEWFQILDDYRILSIDTDQTKYAFTTLHFPGSNYGFFRVTFPVADVKFKRASLAHQKITEPGYQEYDGVSVNESIDKESNETILDITLDQAVPVSFLNIPIKEELDFYRHISIDLVRDSTATPKGWIYNYRNVYKGVINSIEEPSFSFNSTTTRMFRVRIRNYDNAPLDIGEVTVKGYQHELVARFSEKAEYALKYGNQNLNKPNYDIVQFKDKIPDELKTLTVGPEEQIRNNIEKVAPLMSSKLWLWGVLVLIILVLGWFTLGMIKK